jgi:hypothetical protein
MEGLPFSGDPLPGCCIMSSAVQLLPSPCSASDPSHLPSLSPCCCLPWMHRRLQELPLCSGCPSTPQLSLPQDPSQSHASKKSSLMSSTTPHVVFDLRGCTGDSRLLSVNYRLTSQRILQSQLGCTNTPTPVAQYTRTPKAPPQDTAVIPPHIHLTVTRTYV